MGRAGRISTGLRAAQSTACLRAEPGRQPLGLAAAAPRGAELTEASERCSSKDWGV